MYCSILVPVAGSLSLTPKHSHPFLLLLSISLLQHPLSSQHIHLLLPLFTTLQQDKIEIEKKAAEWGKEQDTMGDQP